MIEAYLVGDRSIVLDEKAAKELYAHGFFGNPLSTKKPKSPEDVKPPLVLSQVETLYLLEKGRICVKDVTTGKEYTFEELMERWSNDPELSMKYKVYKEMRERGFVVRSGLKFGADFAAYEFGPGIDHAPYVVEVRSSEAEVEPTELVRAGRVAHGARKRFILALVDDQRVRYVMFKWFLP